jgi:hypothetical protein
MRTCSLLKRLFTLVFVASLNRFAVAEPMASWIPLEGLSERHVIEMQHLRKSRCLPEKKLSKYPVFPKAFVVGLDWGALAPKCDIRDGWSELGAIAFVAMASEKSVIAWYIKHLPSYKAYRSDEGTLLVKEPIVDFLWQRDLHKYSNVAIEKPRQEFLNAGYLASIRFNRPVDRKDRVLEDR